MDIQKYFPHLSPEHYAVINFFVVLPDSEFLWVLDNISRKSGIGLEFHGFEFSEEKSAFLYFYNWSAKPEQTTVISFSDFRPILRTIAKHYQSTTTSDGLKVEKLLDEAERVLQ